MTVKGNAWSVERLNERLDRIDLVLKGLLEREDRVLLKLLELEASR